MYQGFLVLASVTQTISNIILKSFIHKVLELTISQLFPLQRKVAVCRLYNVIDQIPVVISPRQMSITCQAETGRIESIKC